MDSLVEHDTNGVSTADVAVADSDFSGSETRGRPAAGSDPPGFDLPPELEAGEPPEARGLARDAVRLMVSYARDDRVVHTRFRRLPEFLSPGDVLVINTSGTLNAAVPATHADGRRLTAHLSTRLPAGLWMVELRQTDEKSNRPYSDAAPGEVFSLPGGASLRLLTPRDSELRERPGGRVRLWVATLDLPLPMEVYLDRYGSPIRYGYVKRPWPAAFYQTVYANEPGSAEMPSAGRAFTPGLITRLVGAGMQFAPLVLHTGVASLEAHEPPYEEFYRVPPETARQVDSARAAGKRVVAVGTTVVRALETVTDPEGAVHPGSGWTRLVITPERPLRAVDALLTGLHEPNASHLGMLRALAGTDHLRVTYAEALRRRYLWHEFGDLHLIFAGGSRAGTPV